jgi:hypothetical protein
MNKTMKKIALLLFCVYPLFQSCESSFLKSAIEALHPVPGVFVGMQWDNENIIYINPHTSMIEGTMGVISGIFQNSGKRIWPDTDLKDNGPENSAGKRAWKLTSSDEVNYPAGTLISILRNNESPSTANGAGGDLITLNFGNGSVSLGDYDDPDFVPNVVKFSFILTPNAFHGADSVSLTKDTSIDFNLLMPTSTVYGQKWVERNMYGTISTTWGAAGTNAADPAAGMIETAGSLAAYAAEERLKEYTAGTLAFEFDNPDAGGSMAVLSWEPTPDLSRGWARLRNYKLVLTPIRDKYEYEEPFAPVAISAPVTFMSNVGSVAMAIEDAIAAGTFGTKPTGAESPAPDQTGYPYYIQYAGTEGVEPSGSLAVNKLISELKFTGAIYGSLSCLPLENKTSQQTLTIILGPGTDYSPENTLTFKVWVAKE